jgi:hypothetical protein
MTRPRSRNRVPLLIGACLTLMALVITGAALAATGEGPVTVRVGELEVTADGGFNPKALSKTRQTPIAIKASGEVRLQDGGQPPAIREVLIEADKNGEAHTKGIPTCSSGQLQATSTAAALKACGPALIGEGKATAQVAFAEQRPIEVSSKLLLFNGGEKGGKTTWLGHVYFSNPVSGAIVTTVTITKIHRGRFGTLGVVKIPQIAGGAGAGISFDLEIFKSVKVGARTLNPISAACPDGKLKAHIEGHFEDGTQAATEFVRACTSKG